MIIPVRCFTCGKVVSDRYEEFVQRVKKGEDPTKVLDSLGLKRYCCRRMMITAYEYIDEVMRYTRGVIR